MACCLSRSIKPICKSEEPHQKSIKFFSQLKANRGIDPVKWVEIGVKEKLSADNLDP